MCVPSAHWLMAGGREGEREGRMHVNVCMLLTVEHSSIILYSPLQVLPSPFSLNPDLQLHWNEPSELVQVCAQPPLLLLHSLISFEEMNTVLVQTSSLS